MLAVRSLSHINSHSTAELAQLLAAYAVRHLHAVKQALLFTASSACCL
jgi:hypothetical protein